MLTQAYYKGKQKSSAIPAYNTHTNGKLDAKAFYFHFLFSLCAALSPATHSTGKRQPRWKYSQHVTPEVVESSNTQTSATRALLHESVFSKKTTRK